MSENNAKPNQNIETPEVDLTPKNKGATSSALAENRDKFLQALKNSTEKKITTLNIVAEEGQQYLILKGKKLLIKPGGALPASVQKCVPSILKGPPKTVSTGNIQLDGSPISLLKGATKITENIKLDSGPISLLKGATKITENIKLDSGPISLLKGAPKTVPASTENLKLDSGPPPLVLNPSVALKLQETTGQAERPIDIKSVLKKINASAIPLAKTLTKNMGPAVKRRTQSPKVVVPLDDNFEDMIQRTRIIVANSSETPQNNVNNKQKTQTTVKKHNTSKTSNKINAINNQKGLELSGSSQEKCGSPNVPLRTYSCFESEKNRLMSEPIKNRPIIGHDVSFGTGPTLESIGVRKIDSNPSRKNADYEKLKMSFQKCLTPDLLGNLPIHSAVLENNLVKVKMQLIMLKYAKVTHDPKNHQGHTALQLAVISKSPREILEALLKFGARTDIIDSNGNTVIHQAVQNKKPEILEAILDNIELSQKYIFNLYNYEGYTPLMLCAIDDNVLMAHILLRKGADLNLTDQKSGRTALFHAAENNYLKMVNLLLSFNAHTKIKNFNGTSVHDAIFELEGMPEDIKKAILLRSKTLKRKEKRGSMEIVQKSKKIKFGILKDNQRDIIVEDVKN